MTITRIEIVVRTSKDLAGPNTRTVKSYRATPRNLVLATRERVTIMAEAVRNYGNCGHVSTDVWLVGSDGTRQQLDEGYYPRSAADYADAMRIWRSERYWAARERPSSPTAEAEWALEYLNS